jgi:hypothetical protein
MLSLVGVMFGYIAVAQKKAESKNAFIQSNLIVDDLKTILDRVVGGRASKNRLKALYTVPLVVNDKGNRFAVVANCKPLLDRVPAVWLGLRDDKNSKENVNKFNLAKNLFDQLSEQAEIKDSDRLFEMIVEHIKGYSGYFSSPAYIKRREMAITKYDFLQILHRYRYEVDDVNVYRIGWDRYFTFLSNDYQGMDPDFISPDLIPFLFDVDLGYVRENYEMGELDGFLETIGEDKGRYKWLFVKSAVAVECSVHYTLRDNNYNFEFDYIDKRISNFEFF